MLAGVFWCLFSLLSENVLSGLPPSYRQSLAILSMALVFETQLRGLVAGLGNYKARMMASCLGGTLFAAGTVLAALIGWLDVGLLIPLNLLGSIASIVVLFTVVMKQVPTSPSWDRKLLLSMLSQALGAALYRGSNYLNFRVDVFVIATLLDMRTLGIYTLAMSVVEAVTYLPKGISDAVITYAASTRNAHLRRQSRQTLIKLYRGVSLFILGAGGVVAVTSPWLVPVMFSTQFSSAVLP